MTRFDNAVKVIESGDQGGSRAHALFNPEPAASRRGRPLLYDAVDMSANGRSVLRSSCHIFGDNDDLAWDLGNPDDLVTSNPIPIRPRLRRRSIRSRGSTAPAS